jgi:hypothetical protein
MTGLRRYARALVLAVLALGAGSAQAALQVYTIDFEATDFSPAGAPVDPVEGSVTITFDPDIDQPSTTNNIVLNSLNINLDSAISWVYSVGLDLLVIGGFEPSTVGADSNDFFVAIEFGDLSLSNFASSTSTSRRSPNPRRSPSSPPACSASACGGG